MKKSASNVDIAKHHGKNHIINSFRVHSQNPLRVVEAVHESSARTAKSYPATPIAFPGGERITPIIYVGGELAESRNLPLRKIVALLQGIALLKINEKSRFSCNSTEV